MGTAVALFATLQGSPVLAAAGQLQGSCQAAAVHALAEEEDKPGSRQGVVVGIQDKPGSRQGVATGMPGTLAAPDDTSAASRTPAASSPSPRQRRTAPHAAAR